MVGRQVPPLRAVSDVVPEPPDATWWPGSSDVDETGYARATTARAAAVISAIGACMPVQRSNDTPA